MNFSAPDIRDIGYDGKFSPAAFAGRVGVVALATDHTIESDLRRMLPPGAEVFTNRVLNASPVTLESLRAMRGDIARAAAGILPGRGVDIVIYACTSGAAAIGHDVILQSIRQAHPKAQMTTPVESLSVALPALGAKKISMLTPYITEINTNLAKQLSTFAEIVNIDGLGLWDDAQVADIPPAEIARYAKRAYRDGADALFISCTTLRASEVIEEIEDAIGVPVISSNQMLAWRTARLLRLPSPAGFGRLMQY